MGLVCARRRKQQHICSVLQPDVAFGERHDLSFRDHRHAVEVQRREGFARREARFGHAPLDPVATAVGGLMFGERGQELGRRQSLLFRQGCEPRPCGLDTGQSRVKEKKLVSCGRRDGDDEAPLGRRRCGCPARALGSGRIPAPTIPPADRATAALVGLSFVRAGVGRSGSDKRAPSKTSLRLRPPAGSIPIGRLGKASSGGG